ncbi:oxalate decarboxylase family bicupin [Bradyrhizobium neotropicale]|uniref:oxalate decarboxylase family bicupin n=1 Tax=Bradyrhizobium neotropicale TaxID=1497615 RepID=UPI001AD677B3|nr:oxalate decarboxylase family bicupin [Bradyrhizobium neotropicale]MBO4223822.1 cupin domain-containing protein [Bradyrhizobium neotropicale]
MDILDRRTLIAAAAACGATAAAAAKNSNEPLIGAKGAPIIGPRNVEREQQNPDILRPPSTDHGSIPNLRFSFADAHMKIREGGWSREVTVRELPVATTMAGVNMRLKSGAVRELHWHKPAEWAFMLAGRARITAVDNDGHNFISDVKAGDLWYFPSGIPHSIQGLPEDGCEFLLAFPDGSFSEDSTFAITDLFAHTDRGVLAKNLKLDAKQLDQIPTEELFIFQSDPPPPIDADRIEDSLGGVPQDMAFRLMEQQPTISPGGRVRIADTRNFPISTDVAAAHVEVDPGHMREIHWHPNADEWQFYISGKARMTVFAAEGNARTFDYQAGDVGYVPKSMSHFIENTGGEPLQFLELFRSPRFMDVSLAQWMALTPHELVEAHLKIDRSALEAIRKDKQPVI